MKTQTAISLISELIRVFDRKANRGKENKLWKDYKNELGENVGVEMDNIIRISKNLLYSAIIESPVFYSISESKQALQDALIIHKIQITEPERLAISLTFQKMLSNTTKKMPSTGQRCLVMFKEGFYLDYEICVVKKIDGKKNFYYKETEKVFDKEILKYFTL